MKIGLIKEIQDNETRVALAPSTCARLIKNGFEILVESGAGVASSFTDTAYQEVGAEIVDTQTAWSTADIVVKINAPIKVDGKLECAAMKEGALLVALLSPRTRDDLNNELATLPISALSMDAIPRITRAQKMDVLSSMANIAGYRAVIEASNQFGSFFTGQITAAGKVPPARVLIIGAGVAGLAALGAAKGLGAIVRAFDTRESVADQVQSLGGEFLKVEFEESGEGAGGYAKVMSKEFIEAEMALFRKQAPEVDIVITTALIPGKKAPLLWTKDMVEAMKPGSVVVDMAAASGGNCELSENGKMVEHQGVKILGYADLPSRMGRVASELFGTNIYHLLMEMGGAEEFSIDEENDVIRQALVVRDGESKWPPPAMEHPAPTPKLAPEVVTPKAGEKTEPGPPKKSILPLVASVFVLALIAGWGYMRFSDFELSRATGLSTAILFKHLTVFVLACFVGWQVVWNVTAALHTPLMSVTNAISGIIIVGGLASQTTHEPEVEVIIGAVAVFFATINIAGGFYVTHRMLKMFRK